MFMVSWISKKWEDETREADNRKPELQNQVTPKNEDQNSVGMRTRAHDQPNTRALSLSLSQVNKLNKDKIFYTVSHLINYMG